MTPDPYRPPVAPIRPARSRPAAPPTWRYRTVVLVVATIGLVEGVGEWAFGIPFRRTYFPDQHRPHEHWWAAGWSLLGALGLLEGITLAVHRRWRRGDRPASAAPTRPED